MNNGPASTSTSNPIAITYDPATGKQNVMDSSLQNAATVAYDSSGNTIGLVGAGGNTLRIDQAVSKSSGDVSGVTDRVALQALFDASAANGSYGFIARDNYVIDDALVLSTNTNIVLAPGTVIKLVGKSAPTSTWTTANAVVAVNTVAGLKVGMHVSDPLASLAAGNPVGRIPRGTTILSINPAAKTVTLSATPTGAGVAEALNFHPRSNVIIGTNVSNFSLTCPGGWATLDGNGSNSYPYNVGQDDGLRNVLRLVSPVDWQIDGIESVNAFYHGMIVAGQFSGARVSRYRGRNNGFRGLHMHGEAIVNGSATPECRDNWYGRVELSGNGWAAFNNCKGGDELNSGLFAIFDNVINTQIDTIVIKNEYGHGVHIAGGGGAFVPNFPAQKAQFGNVIVENCGIGLGIYDQTRHIQISNLLVTGSSISIASATFFADASTLAYSYDYSGTLSSYATRRIEMPAGSIDANSLRPGMRVFASGGTTGMPTYGTIISSVSRGTGASGADVIWVFNQDIPANDPYTTAGTTTLYVRGCRDHGMFISTPVNTIVRNIKFGRITMDNPGRYGIYTNYTSSQHRYYDVDFGNVSITGATQLTLNIASLNGFSFASLNQRNSSNGFPTGTISGSQDSMLYNCANFKIDNFRHEHDAAFTSNNKRIRFDIDCRNGILHAVSVKKPASGATIEVLTPIGAAANTSGVAGPIVLANPMASDGTQLTVTGSHIARTDATACIVTRPVDG